MQPPACEAGWPPRWSGRGIRSRAGGVGGKVAASHLARDGPVRAKKRIRHDRSGVGPVPVREHHAGHLGLQIQFKTIQKIAMPAEKAISATTAMAEVHG